MAVELRPFGVACNIACRYCYQNPQREAGNIRLDYDLDRMKAAVEREGGPFTLFGGEPLLMPLTDLKEIFRWGLEQYGSNSIQTNGTLISDAHIRLFQQYRVQVGVSVDGPDELNDLRWHGSPERTRQSTALTLANIARLCREHRPPGLIVTLHRVNASAERLPRLQAWVREMDGQGITMMRLHLLEVDSEAIRAQYSLTEAENVQALLSFAELQRELKQLRFDVLDEMEQALLGRDRHSSCVWHACDPYTTLAVRGVEGNGQSSNCGRTNKDGVNFIKAEQPSFERYIALYQTPQEEGGCKDCRFFLMCKGQCPGTAIDGDWRNRSELCGVWKELFTHLEARLLAAGEVPLSRHPVRRPLEQVLLERWVQGGNSAVQGLQWPDSPAGDAAGAAPGSSADAAAGAGPGFRMPPFVRHAFVGEAQRAVWAPRMAAVRSASGRVGVLAAVRQLVPVSVVSVVPADVLAIHNLAAGYGLHALLLPRAPHERRERLAIGGEEAIAAYRQALETAVADAASDLAESGALAELRGIPACCRRAHEGQRRAGRTDPVWQAVSGGRPGSLADLECPPMLNPLLRQLGINLLGYVPCSFTCEECWTLAAAWLALGREGGLTQDMDWLVSMLAWPMEWTALHGVAEVKTGILRVAYATHYTSGRVTIRYPGRALPPDAARGLSFAYRDPKDRRREAVAPPISP